MKDLEQTIKWTQQYCQHYDGRSFTSKDGCCHAGVNYEQAFNNRIPCHQGNERTTAEQLAICPKWQQKTREQGIERFNQIQKSMERMRIAGPVILAWRNKPPRGKQEIIDCPVCEGRLHLSQSSHNGHVHGRCETAGCLNWME